MRAPTMIQSFNGVYELDRAHSTVQFAIRHLNVSTFRASFSDIDARLTIENDSIALDARAQVESVSIVDPPEFRDHVVRGEDFFAADDHPLITFHSTSVELEEDGRATVTGELDIRGITRSVTASGRIDPPTEDPFGTWHAGLELRRHDRPERLEAELADAPARRPRRTRMGRRDHRSPRADEGALMRLLGVSGSLRKGSYNSALLEAAAAQRPRDVEFVIVAGSCRHTCLRRGSRPGTARGRSS